jgi:hypothetical protein
VSSSLTFWTISPIFYQIKKSCDTEAHSETQMGLFDFYRKNKNRIGDWR